MLRVFLVTLSIILLPSCVDAADAVERTVRADESGSGGACAGVDRVGHCDGATVVWCGPENTLLTVNCREAGYEGCAFNGQLFDCLSYDASYASCVDRLMEDCRAETGSGMCATAASPPECEANEERAAQVCVEDQVTHGACQ